MSAILAVMRAGPLTTIQDCGRFGMLRHGISASGPMDGAGYGQAGQGGVGAVEITMAGVDLRVSSGSCRVGFAGGVFKVKHNGRRAEWPGAVDLVAGDTLVVTPGPAGNYGYLRFDTDIVAPAVMGSIATSSRARLGGLDGRALRAGDVIALGEAAQDTAETPALSAGEGPIRFVWGLHADVFGAAVREDFLARPFTVSTRMDRMGVRLDDGTGVFADAAVLSLVSDATVVGDIQILGDGSPIVLMRDHQPTGGYPRIGTIITADLDRFAQMRPGTNVHFASISAAHARQVLRRGAS